MAVNKKNMKEKATLSTFICQRINTLPPAFLAASISAFWNEIVFHGFGTKLLASPITENTIVGFVILLSPVNL